MTLQTVRHTMDFAFNTAVDEAVLPAVPRPLVGPDPAAHRDGHRRRATVSASRADGPRARLRKAERSSPGRWLRKIVGFPIGERFATISVGAALFDARVTFGALLVLGGCAAAYSGVGRVLRSLGRRGPVALSRRTPSHETGRFRDDGPLALALGRSLASRLPLPPIVLVAGGALPLLVAAAIGDAPWGVAGAVVAWAVLLCGASSGRPLRDRLRWAVTPGVRLVEYAGIIWLAALAGDAALPAAFALLGAITFRHYDAFYRVRQRGDAPPRWIAIAAGGWDGRLLAVLLLTAAGAAPAGLYVAAALLGALLVGESVASCIAQRRAGAALAPADDLEEDAA
jgi:hypothetical protein